MTLGPPLSDRVAAVMPAGGRQGIKVYRRAHIHYGCPQVDACMRTASTDFFQYHG